MHKNMSRICSMLILGTVAIVPVAGRAEMGPDGGAHGMMKDGMHGHPRVGDAADRGWRDSLTDEQKAEIDWITLRLSQRQQLLEAQMEVKEAELNQLLVGDDVVQEQWHAKLDELMQLKREYLMNKYQRVTEVRQVLTPQQRVSFDLDILSRRQIDGGH